MNRKRVLKVINLVMAADFMLLVVSALFSRLIYQTGYYFYFHAIPGMIFIGLVVFHVVLNLKWIKNVYFGRSSDE